MNLRCLDEYLQNQSLQRHGMQAGPLDLDRGFFQFTRPYTFWGWVVWVIGAILLLVPLVDQELFLLALLGLAIIGGSAPTSLAASLHEIRKNAPSNEELEAQALGQGYEIQSWFWGRTTMTPTNDPSDWILPAPGPSSWNENAYMPHGEGTPLPEHPVKIGTPHPATMTTYGVIMSLLIMIVGYGFLIISAEGGEDMRIIQYILSGVMMIWLLYSLYQNKIVREMLDTPTSLIRSVPVGGAELVGQVRAGPSGTLNVIVDENPERTVPLCLAYKWEYEIYVCREVRDSEGNTKTVCNWETVRSDSGSVPFILNDGTGGIKVQTSSFKRTDFGEFRKRWESTHADTLLKNIKSELMTSLLRGGDVRRHRWTIYALRLGDPAFIQGTIQSRPQEEVQSEGLDTTVQNTLIEVTGEDQVGSKSILRRGTELSVLGRLRSNFERLILPAISTCVMGLSFIV